MSKVLILYASQTNNRSLAQTIATALSSTPLSVEMVDLVDLNLPLYTPSHQEAQGVPAAVASLSQLCDACDAFVVVSPEYNGGIPPVLTNAIAWLSVNRRDWRHSFNQKWAVIAGFSGGGGVLMASALRLQLAYIGLTVIGLPLLANASTPLKSDDLDAVVSQLVRAILGPPPS